jgi:hypothetical protein
LFLFFFSSGLFTAFLSLANYFFLILILVKYFTLRNAYSSKIEEISNNNNNDVGDLRKRRILNIMNDISLIIGILVKINSILLQSFHSHSSKQIHKISSLLTIIFLIIYLWFQTLFTINFKIKKSIVSTSKEIVLIGGLIEFSKNFNDKKYEHSIIILILFLTRFFLIFLTTFLFLLFLYSLNPILQWLSVVLILIYCLTFVIDFYFYDYKFNLSPICYTKSVTKELKQNSKRNNEDSLSIKSFSSSGYNSNRKKKSVNRNEIVKFISTSNFNNNDLENAELSQNNQQRRAASLIFTYV